MNALLGLLRKEVFHILRDRRTLVVIVALPVLQVVIFGYAIRTDVDQVRLAIVDPAPDTVTLAMRARFSAARVFEEVAVVPRIEALDDLFRRGTAQGAIVFEPTSNVSVHGTLWRAPAQDARIRLLGNGAILYSSAALAAADAAFPGLLPHTPVVVGWQEP